MSFLQNSTKSNPIPLRTRKSPLSGIETPPDFFFEALEIYDSSASYAKAKVKLPNDVRCTGNRVVLSFLASKIMAEVACHESMQNLNVYYYEQDAIRPEALLLLSAHIIQDGLLQADISSPGGCLMARAYALCGTLPQNKHTRRFLESPIAFNHTGGDRTESTRSSKHSSDVYGSHSWPVGSLA
jgi:hypothetical protein